MTSMLKRSAFCLAASAALVTGTAGIAGAQPLITGGLVNVTLVDVLSGNEVAVQIPIGVAANVCGVSVGVLAELANTGDVRCEGTVEQLPRAFQ
ncbi:Small secreted domain [Geodermatophilus saharensis]|uniref:Small secreted domain n=1 Tax=Geodermatophilus saharensis TaxID=1137994 RepID=A0A239BWH4_9ACTN|nr:chaplin family protein [Geodermatophilus saharensis]SNS12240.1 Small secreted domain [Geodermatophilus saharensis]